MAQDNNSKIQLFVGQKVRTIWVEEEQQWYFAIPDVCGILAESDNPQTYWRVLKNRLKKEGNQTVTNCNAFKLRAADGKLRLTDVATQQQLFRIIPFDQAQGKRTIPSKKAEPFKSFQFILSDNRRNKLRMLQRSSAKMSAYGLHIYSEAV